MKKSGVKVVLLERIQTLGKMGDVVTVKRGYAKNFLLPKSKALRATADNIAHFEKQRAHLEQVSNDKRTQAEGIARTLDNQAVVIIRQASEAGNLYGSVGPRDIAEAITAKHMEINRHQVVMPQPLKLLGVHQVTIALHPEVSVSVLVSIAQTAEEGQTQLTKFTEDKADIKSAGKKAAKKVDEAITEVLEELQPETAE